MLAIDQRVTYVLFPIIGIAILQTARVEPEEGVMREKQRPAMVRAERQPDAVELATVPEISADRPATMVGVGTDGIAW